MVASDVGLKALDKAVANRTEALGRRQHKIDSIASMLADSGTDSRRFALEMELSALYSDYMIDSALLHLDRADCIASMSRDTIAVLRAAMHRAGLYNSALMMYREAGNIFDAIDPSCLCPSDRSDYFTLGVQLYKNLEQLSPSGELRKKYADKKRIYRDSVLVLTPSAYIVHANQLMDQGRIADALELMLANTDTLASSEMNGAAYHVIANIYDRQGNISGHIRFLTRAALADLENGVREYLALPELALALYAQGDVDRAYRYMHRSIEDARTCNARIRLLEMASDIPVVDAAYNAMMSRSRKTLTVILCITVLLAILLSISLLYARRRNRLLHEARKNEAMINDCLRQANEVKEKYVVRYMNLSLGYLSKMDSYRAGLFKIAAKRNFDLLYDAIASTCYIDNELSDFYRGFDEAFLELFPDFVDNFNSRLRDGEKISLKSGERMNTELRIFALMKLGITDTSMIAKFLRCSSSTIYNYRTRIRKRTIDGGDPF